MDPSRPSRPVFVAEDRDGWSRRLGARVEVLTSEEAQRRFPAIPRGELAGAVHFIEPGRVSSGAEAALRALSYASGGRWLWLYERLPGASAVAEVAFRLATRARGESAPGVWTRWLFLRLLGAVSVVAVASFWRQMPGLIGSRGIWPAAEQLASFRAKAGGAAFGQLPTLAWLGASDGLLHGLCAAGVGLGVLLLAGVAPRLVIGSLWLVWLSLVNVGGPFLRFQWDVLLLEALFVAFFYAPAGLLPWPRREGEPPPAALFMLRWLLFRLMLLDGLVKLFGDPSWRELGALGYHFWTQPLPAWTSHFAHHLPGWVQAGACLLLLLIELLLPALALGPRPGRLVAFVGFAALLLALMVSGNTSYFGPLALALCLPLLDDEVLRRFAPRRLRPLLSRREEPPSPSPLARSLPVVAVALLVTSLGVLVSLERLLPGAALPEWLLSLNERVGRYKLVNGYGAFAKMTRARPEIILEGSDDGLRWSAYELPFKPGAVDRRPALAAPYHPRLDWQLWFAALGECEDSPWFHALERRLLEGAPEVKALFALDPFFARPPRYLRSTRYQYRFSAPEARRRGVWWERELLGPFCPGRQRPSADEGGGP